LQELRYFALHLSLFLADDDLFGNTIFIFDEQIMVVEVMYPVLEVIYVEETVFQGV